MVWYKKMRPLSTVVTVFCVVTIWCVVITFLYVNQLDITRNNQGLMNFEYKHSLQNIGNQLDELERKYERDISLIKKELASINKGTVYAKDNNDYDNKSSTPIAVLILACNRITVSRAIESVLRYRTSEDKFPVIVSQDCSHEETSKVIDSYKDKLTHIMQPDTSDIIVPQKENRMKGYYKISRHYKWALAQVFDKYGYTLAIIIEDDLEVGPDFFSYMESTSYLLSVDKTLLCVSAWNDNGKKNLIDVTRYDLLYRSDFFPGLGWMLSVDLWRELKPKWPASYWDDWLRLNVQRKGRSCIRPEISRTMTFGRVGVSNGEHFDKHLQFISLGREKYDFKTANLSYLMKENYQTVFVKKVYQLPIVLLNEALEASQDLPKEFTVKYTSKKEFSKFAMKIGLMSDFKDGVPRTAYKGIVSFYNKGHRIHLIPYTQEINT